MLLGDFNSLKTTTLCNSFKLKQIVQNPTRKEAILDKVLTNMADYYGPPVVGPQLGSSDHNIVIASPCSGTSWKHKICSRSSVTYRQMKPEQLCAFKIALEKQNWTKLYHAITCQEQYDIFEQVLQSLIETYFPCRTKQSFSNDKPWISESFKKLIAKRQKAFLAGDTMKYKVLRNKVNHLSKSLHSNFYKSTIHEYIDEKPRQWWKGIKKILGDRKSDSTMITLASGLCDGDMSKLANIINTAFKHVSDDIVPLSNEQYIAAEVVPEQYIISVFDVQEKLSKIKTHKAIGPDGIPNKILKTFADLLAPPVCAIFNSSLRESYVPPMWKSALVIPLPKVTPVSKVEKDLRPISLTPVLSKVLESFVVGWIRSESQHSDTQFGAVQNRSTTHALIELLHKIHCELDGSQAYARILLLDFSKAFDHIDHHILLDKLSKSSVHPILTAWQKSFLTERQQRIKIGDTLSDPAILNGGVPQGTLSGPEDFLHMIDDFQTCLQDIKFVDDTTIFEIVPLGQSSKMQLAANEANDWAKRNNMSLNAGKTKEIIVYFGKKDVDIPPVILEGTAIKQVSEANLLGVKLNKKLNWDDHVDALVKKAYPRLHYLRLLKRAGVAPAQLVTVYKSLVRSLAEYACQAWSTSLTSGQSNKLEKLQQRALRIILPELKYDEAMKQLNLPSMSERRNKLCNKLFRSIQEPEHSLHKLLPGAEKSQYNLRKQRLFQIPKCKTNRCKNSYINWCLSEF